MNRNVLVLAAMLAFPLAASPGIAARLQPSDLYNSVNPSDPQISPDGKQVVVVVSRPSRKENRSESELILVDVASGSQRSLTWDRRVSGPRWSPSGDRIAFLATDGKEKDAKRQIFVLPLGGGDARRITTSAKGVQQFAWSPDGGSIAFVTSDEAEKRGDDDKFNMSFEIGNDDYLTSSAPLVSHVWVTKADGGDARRITSGTWTVPIAHPPGPAPSPLSWSPDGRTLAITHVASPHSGDADSAWIELVDVATGTVHRITPKGESESHPVFSPDGSRIAYLYPRDGERTNLADVYVASSTGGEGRNLTRALDRNMARAIWMPDSKALIVGGHDLATTSLWLQPLDGAARKIDTGDIEPYSPFWLDVSVAGNGSFVFTGSTASRPRELFFMSSAAAKPRALTHLNDELASREMGRSERVTWKNDGFDEDGVLTFPPGFDTAKKYPLVVYIHGGPRASSTTSFSMLPQLFAAQNWIVFQPNYRGSDNLGNAYERAIAKDSGAGPGRDVMAGIEAVIARGNVDRDRIVVGGWSYGGYMTSWMIGHYPIFKAAVSGAAVNNLVEAYSLSDTNTIRRYMLGGSPFTSDENMKRYIEQSPLTYASKVKTPTLILSDTGDARVPIAQSYEFFHALRDNGTTVKFIAYPVSGHSPEDPAHNVDIYRRYLDWFSQYLK